MVDQMPLYLEAANTGSSNCPDSGPTKSILKGSGNLKSTKSLIPVKGHQHDHTEENLFH